VAVLGLLLLFIGLCVGVSAKLWMSNSFVAVELFLMKYLEISSFGMQ